MTESDSSYRWLIGVLLAAIASVISNLGLTLQKLSHKRNQAMGAEHAMEHTENYHKDPIWMVGLALVILGSVADLAALGFAAQSIVAPLGSLTLVSNVLLAPLILGEKLDKRDLMATLAIVIGSGVSVAFATHEETSYTIQELFGFYVMPRFFVYAALVVATVLVMLYYINYIENVYNTTRNNPNGGYANLRGYHRFLYAALSGVIGAQSVLFAKCFAELVVNSLIKRGEWIIFTHYQTYFVVGAMVACILWQIKYLNSGLLRFDAVTVVPIFQSFWILISVVAGLVFFGESSNFSVVQALMFPLGVFVTIGGIYTLSLRGTSDAERSIEGFSELSSPDEYDTSPLVRDRLRSLSKSNIQVPRKTSKNIEVGNQVSHEYVPISSRAEVTITTEELKLGKDTTIELI